MTTVSSMSRRHALAAAALACLSAGCSTPLPLNGMPPADIDADAKARLHDSAMAHGLEAFKSILDINVGYEGRWRPLIGRIQPEVVDDGFRGSSQERLLPRLGVVAQEYSGPRGHKHVTWQRARSADDRTGRGDIAVWFNGVRSEDAAALDAAALVAEAYGLFLLGPLWIEGRSLAMRSAGTEQVDGRLCDVVEVWLQPGLGRVALDRIALCIDRSDGLVHRLRFTLEGFAGTQGAVAEVDTFEHERLFGVTWPMRSNERVVHPLQLPAHDWRIVGLDVNRGYGPAELTGPLFSGPAAAQAKAVR